MSMKVVAYHDGGRMFAGDDTEYSPGWYLYDKDREDGEPELVTVLRPYTNEPLEVKE